MAKGAEEPLPGARIMDFEPEAVLYLPMAMGRTAENRELDYLEEARAILEGLASGGGQDKAAIKKSQILKLLRAKHRAYTESNMGFEEILIDVVRMFDERAQQDSDSSVFNKFSIIVTYFDRYDYVQKTIGNIVFKDDASLSVETLISLFGNKKVFDRFEKGLFYELFIQNLLSSGNLAELGRRKLRVLAFGLEKMTLEKASLDDVVREFEKIGT
jgi:uncharacterized protein (TIGR04442 family)